MTTHMRNYRSQLLSGSVPNFYPDPEPTIPDGGTILGDTVQGGQGADTVQGGQGADTLVGGQGNDTVQGGQDDTLKGGQGNDTIQGGQGNDIVQVPEAYELKAPDGQELDPAAVAAATPIFKELGLDNAKAQKLTDFYVGQMQTVAQTVQGETLRLLGLDQMAKWTDMVKADKELGGADFEKNLTIIAAGRNQFASPELRAFFETSRIGNHPEMVRLFHKLGTLVQEGKFHTDGGGAGTPKGGPEGFYDPAFSPKA